MNIVLGPFWFGVLLENIWIPANFGILFWVTTNIYIIQIIYFHMDTLLIPFIIKQIATYHLNSYIKNKIIKFFRQKVKSNNFDRHYMGLQTNATR